MCLKSKISTYIRNLEIDSFCLGANYFKNIFIPKRFCGNKIIKSLYVDPYIQTNDLEFFRIFSTTKFFILKSIFEIFSQIFKSCLV